MDFYSNLIEYFDELFPLDTKIIDFFKTERSKSFSDLGRLCRVLEVTCCTASVAHALAREDFDVTGIDSNPKMIETADRRKKVPVTNIRFYDMTIVEMSRFLKGNFEFVLSKGDICSRLKDKILLKKFFYDTKNILSPNGTFVLFLPNYEKFLKEDKMILPERTSTRAKLSKTLEKSADGFLTCNSIVTFSNSSKHPVTETKTIYPFTKAEIYDTAKEVGFSSIEFYKDFSLEPFSDSCPKILAIMK